MNGIGRAQELSLAALQRELAEPWISLRQTGDGVLVSGSLTASCGHPVTRAQGPPDGIFASWHWDGEQLIVRNDRYGFHPLFYCRNSPSEVAFSTSPLRLLAGGAPAELDADALSVFLRLGFFVGEDTAFRAIRAVPPDADVRWENGVLQMSGKYCHGKPLNLSRDSALDAYISLFRQAVQRREPVDDNFVVPLSGGRDSRHILFALCHLGRRPRFAVTIPRYPPRAPEDERVAALVARVAGVEHRLLPVAEPRLAAELQKNWLTKLCADEHAWYMGLIGYLQENVTTVYDGMGGALSVAGRFLSPTTLALFESRRFRSSQI